MDQVTLDRLLNEPRWDDAAALVLGEWVVQKLECLNGGELRVSRGLMGALDELVPSGGGAGPFGNHFAQSICRKAAAAFREDGDGDPVEGRGCVVTLKSTEGHTLMLIARAMKFGIQMQLTAETG